MSGLPERTAGTAEVPRASAWKAVICDLAAETCQDVLGPGLRALVLTGSLARDEGTFIESQAGAELLGDAEFLVLLTKGARMPDAFFTDLSRRVERELARRGLRGHVSLTGCRPRYLRRLKPHIFAYELRACGQVVRGDGRILDLVPSFDVSAIPREDAWRLLCNRMVELVEAAAAADRKLPVGDGRPAAAPWLPPAVHYATVKLYLDMGTSLLAFLGHFEPGYRARVARLNALARDEAYSDRLGFPLRDLATCVEACTCFKLDPRPVPREVSWSFVEEALACAHRLWRWELAGLTGLGKDATDDLLWERWMEQQPVPGRLRGWLQVARTQGWLKGWRDRARWPRLAWRASPRYWVYRAAVALVSGEKHAGEPGEERWEALRDRLPAQAPDADTAASPRHRLARDISWNYQRFLVHTQS
jgi:hypothetical protein